MTTTTIHRIMRYGLWIWVQLAFLNGVYCPWVPKLDTIVDQHIGVLRDQVWTMRGPDKKNPNYCPLHPSGVYPYLIKIWADTSHEHLFLRTGVLLSHRAVLTTCYGFSLFKMTDYKLYAQRTFTIIKKKREICFQTRKIAQWYTHPKCVSSRPDRPNAFYDIQVLELDETFYAEEQFAYPSVPIPKQAFDLLHFIRKVRILHENIEGCEIPTFQDVNSRYPVLSIKGKVVIKMHDEVCLKTICNPRATEITSCMDRMRQVTNNTFLCVNPEFLWKIPTNKANTWMGCPLVCNNTAVGIVTGNLFRPGFPRDWYFVLTFLRVWPWLMSMKAKFWNQFYNRDGNWDSPFLEDHLWVWHKFTTPKHDKNIDKEIKNRFRIVTPHYKAKKKKKSGGDRLHVTSTVLTAFFVTFVI